MNLVKSLEENLEEPLISPTDELKQEPNSPPSMTPWEKLTMDPPSLSSNQPAPTSAKPPTPSVSK
eukprot:10423067-Heterocapsa_arctica.AAC.1